MTREPAGLILARQNLLTPLGLSGSGRQRYAAAMALFEAGQISDEALEIYRICSLLDHEDPTPLLTAAGLPLPAEPAGGDLARGLRLKTLLAECDLYLAGLTGPGIAEVRAGLAPALAAENAPLPRPVGGANAVVSAHLASALASLEATHPELATAIAASTGDLEWITYGEYPPDEIGADFLAGHAYTEMVGPEAPVFAPDYDLGLFLIAPDLLYRDHRHPAPELYAPLTGPHGWRFGPGDRLKIKPAHDPVWNPPNTPHMTKVGPVPFLCIFGWTKDVRLPASVIPTTDWRELEMLRITVF
jgi:hypothetical protein